MKDEELKRIQKILEAAAPDLNRRAERVRTAIIDFGVALGPVIKKISKDINSAAARMNLSDEFKIKIKDLTAKAQRAQRKTK